jgi:hypothetical protein
MVFEGLLHNNCELRIRGTNFSKLGEEGETSITVILQYILSQCMILFSSEGNKMNDIVCTLLD